MKHSGNIRCRCCGHRFDALEVELKSAVACPACAGSFIVDGRSFAKHDRNARPLGFTRIADYRGVPRREIKAQLTPDRTGWTLYARWWWIENKGPIPPGYRVFHVDGNSLNDDPSNYALGRFADGIHAKAMENPDWWAKHVRKLRTGCIEHNRLRGEIKRATSWNPSQWYPVDLTARQIINTPAKKASRVYAAFGIADANCDRRISIALGWPGVPMAGAVALSCLMDRGGSLRSDALYELVNAFMAFRHWSEVSAPGLRAAIWRMSKSGLVTIHRGGRHAATVRITDAAIAARIQPCPITVIHGSRLADEPFRRFAKVNADRIPIGRERADGMTLLAQAIADSRNEAA